MGSSDDGFVGSLAAEVGSPEYQAQQAALSLFQATCGSGATLLSVCLGLRMAHTGIIEPHADVHARCAALRARLDAWTPSYHPSRVEFDEAVRRLVLATLAEVQNAPPRA